MPFRIPIESNPRMRELLPKILFDLQVERYTDAHEKMVYPCIIPAGFVGFSSVGLRQLDSREYASDGSGNNGSGRWIGDRGSERGWYCCSKHRRHIRPQRWNQCSWNWDSGGSGNRSRYAGREWNVGSGGSVCDGF